MRLIVFVGVVKGSFCRIDSINSRRSRLLERLRLNLGQTRCALNSRTPREKGYINLTPLKRTALVGFEPHLIDVSPLTPEANKTLLTDIRLRFIIKSNRIESNRVESEIR